MRYKYKLQKHDGIVAIIIYKNKLLLLERRNLPIILNPGIWAFLSGGRDGKEKYLDTAYREIKEEVKLSKQHLKLLYKAKVYLKEERKKIIWANELFIFRSDTDKIKLDMENKAYRWATLKQIEKEINYTNILINEKRIIRHLKGFISAKMVSKR